MLEFPIPRIVQLLAVGITGRRSVDIKELLGLHTQRPPLTLRPAGDALAAHPLVESGSGLADTAAAANPSAGQVEAALAAVTNEDAATASAGSGGLGACGAVRESAGGESGGSSGRWRGVLVVGTDDVDGGVR